MACELILSGGVQSIANVDHALPFRDAHEALQGKTDEAGLRGHVKLIDRVEPLDALAGRGRLAFLGLGWASVRLLGKA